MNIRPLHDRVVVKRIDTEGVQSGEGLHLPERDVRVLQDVEMEAAVRVAGDQTAQLTRAP